MRRILLKLWRRRHLQRHGHDGRMTRYRWVILNNQNMCLLL